MEAGHLNSDITINVTDYVRLKQRVGYLRAQERSIITFGLFSGGNPIEDDILPIISCEEVSPNEVATLFACLQADDLAACNIPRFTLEVLVNFSEYFDVPFITELVSKRFFQANHAMAAKSVLWVFKNEHKISPFTVFRFLNVACAYFHTSEEILRQFVPETPGTLVEKTLAKLLRSCRRKFQYNLSLRKLSCFKCQTLHKFRWGHKFGSIRPTICCDRWICKPCRQEHLTLDSCSLCSQNLSNGIPFVMRLIGHEVTRIEFPAYEVDVNLLNIPWAIMSDRNRRKIRWRQEKISEAHRILYD